MDEAIEDYLRSAGFSVRPGWSIPELFDISEVVTTDAGDEELHLRFRDGVVTGPGTVIGAEDESLILSSIESETPRHIIVLAFNWDDAPEELSVVRVVPDPP
jgi:hypothetical protein